GYDLYRIASFPDIFRNLKQLILQEQIFLGRIIPIEHKAHCKRSDSRPFDAEVCIPPITELLISAEILPSHVKTADKSDPSVDDHDFPVVPVINAELKFS